jgi:isopentenyl diphosphate isomerase/L-lactate dehydrogenase-like FMN-dependent dehydrogenase
MNTDSESRRRFLGYLLASPLLAPIAELANAVELLDELISSPEEALNVFDLEAVARRELSPAHFGYLQTGVDGDATLRANREAFARYQLRTRRLIDVRRVDMGVRVLGTDWESPIVLSPIASQQAFHPEGEIAVARAAHAKKMLLMYSTVSTASVEDVTEARQAPVWFQLYPTNQWRVAQTLVKRAERAGCPVLVLTVDLQGGSNRESLLRAQRRDPAQCTDCHEGGPSSSLRSFVANKPMFDDLDLSGVVTTVAPDMSWEYIARLRDITSMKIVIKGIVTREDAELAIEHGVDGIMVSNHGGRGTDSGRAAIECLAEVVEGVGGAVPVLVDSGFRRGTDIFKALALGATAVGIGRPYIWGLGAFGQPGVEVVLDLLRRELRTVMRQAGTLSISDISPSYLVDRGCY